MPLRKLRRWHWLTIGLLVGAALGLVRLNFSTIGPTPIGIGQAEFERLLLAAPALGKYPALDDVTVVPIDDLYWVRAQRRYPTPDGQGFEYRTQWLALRDRHYHPVTSTAPRGTDYTVRDFLADAAAHNPNLQVHYAWQRDPRFALPAWTLGGALLIGVVWPWLLSSLAGPQPPEPNYDLNRFTPDPPSAPTQAPTLSISPLDAEIESHLTEPHPLSPPPTPVLTDQPLSAPPSPIPSSKEYDGEFYPTETHVKPHPSRNHA